MKLPIVILLLLAANAAAEPIYSVVVRETGQSIVLVELDKGESCELFLPLDAELEVKGAIYLRNGTALIAHANSLKPGLIVYSTHAYTAKTGSQWSFNMDLGTGASATLLLPDNAVVRSFHPSPEIHSSKLVFRDADRVTVAYQLEQSDERLPALGYVVVAVASMALPFAVFSLRNRKRQSAKQHVIKTLAPNERVIMRHLLESDEVKRNRLERATGLSKSSLANSLNNLEQKGIIEIDRTNVVHRVRQSGWFRGI